MSSDAKLRVANLSLSFKTREGTVHVLDDVSLDIGASEIVALVGESGSGKSVLASAIVGLLPDTAKITSGSIAFNGARIMEMDERALRALRGRQIAMVYQNARSALNPVETIGAQLKRVFSTHLGLAGTGSRQASLGALRAMRISDPERRLRQYPFELSGGLCQRVMMALALACDPQLLIADEATTGLDVTTQKAVLDLLSTLVRQRGMSALLITHDLAVASQFADRIVVMHAGQVVESAPASELVREPLHPYTKRLLASFPDRGRTLADLVPVAGAFPNLRTAQPSCRFSGRCDLATEDCRSRKLPEVAVRDLHVVRCQEYAR